MPSPATPFPKDFLEMLSALLDAGVEFLMIGGHALAIHGLPRATKDMDLWVHATPSNAKRVMRALRSFQAPLHEIRVEDFQSAGLILQIGVPPNRIDLLTSIVGVSFPEAWTNREMLLLDDLHVPVISRRDLLKNKEATGRKQDAADVERLRQLFPDLD